MKCGHRRLPALFRSGWSRNACRGDGLPGFGASTSSRERQSRRPHGTSACAEHGPQGAAIRETSFEHERAVQSRPTLGRWTAELAERPEANAAKPAREQLTLIRVFEEFRGHSYDTATMLYSGTPNDGRIFTSPGDWVRNRHESNGAATARLRRPRTNGTDGTAQQTACG
jgi:hypothetical protein